MKNILQNRIALVTGGTTGIGKAIALKFAEEGATVFILGSNPEKGETALKEIANSVPGAKVEFLRADISKTEETNRIAETILSREKRLDILVNNAGITADKLLMQMSEEDWDRVMGINLKGCYNTCRAFVRSMMKAEKGKIINIASVVGLVGNIGQVNYAASKAGMIGFTKALAKELARRNISVNCIAPGFIRTAMTDVLSDTQKEAVLKNIPFGRMGEPRDIADIAWFLASPLSDYITGQVLTVDGGMVM